MLYYGLDGLNWFQAGCIAMSKNPLQSFMYTVPVVDGDDLLIISRSSQNAPNQHDADTVTFHRVHDFRTLAHGFDTRGLMSTRLIHYCKVRKFRLPHFVL